MNEFTHREVPRLGRRPLSPAEREEMRAFGRAVHGERRWIRY